MKQRYYLIHYITKYAGGDFEESSTLILKSSAREIALDVDEYFREGHRGECFESATGDILEARNYIYDINGHDLCMVVVTRWHTITAAEAAMCRHLGVSGWWE
jgi:hypothetical protein